MITQLYIKDFILIKELTLRFHGGFTTITGETGAGKSILVGAIGLILGNRADTKTIREGANKAIIEAEFDLEGIAGLEPLFVENDLDYDNNCTLRRELLSNGKSRAFVNDTPVSLSVIKRIGERLVDIHSQHHNMLIGEEDYQMSVLDTLASLEPFREEYAVAFDEYSAAKKELTAFKERLARKCEEQEYIAFQLAQLTEANLLPGELAELEARQSVAQHGAEIAEALHCVAALAENDGDREGSLQQLRDATKRVGRIAGHFAKAEQLAERLESIEVELNDITREASGLLDDVEVDPQELEQIEARLDLLQGLLFRYKLVEYDELIALRDRYAEELEAISTSDEALSQLTKSVELKKNRAEELANNLTAHRQQAAKALLPDLHLLMKELGIAGATFKVELQPLPQLCASGGDRVQFLFATNKQSTLQPIWEIASGGEISRFMLALKTILAEHTVLPTVIFDEIDTGVSGEVAEKLGRVMARLGKNIQVLSITHLPQIAALASRQLLVAKEEEEEGFFTSIREVEGEERVKQLASMLTGAEMTEAALANARELLKKK